MVWVLKSQSDLEPGSSATLLANKASMAYLPGPPVPLMYRYWPGRFFGCRTLLADHLWLVSALLSPV